MNQQAPLHRFSSRAAYYTYHRPGYPPALYDYIRHNANLDGGAPVADVGSGTGLLTQLFLKNGHPVFGIEPNPAMRQAGEDFLLSYPHFHSLDGRAEALPLEDASVALVVAGQAFHWFSPTTFRSEAQRILPVGGQVALIWNRRILGDPLINQYETLLDRYAIDYYQADPTHRMTDEKIADFFAPQPLTKVVFPNPIRYDWEGLFGLAMSQSYVPLPHHSAHADFLTGLQALFESYQHDGHITWALETFLYHAPIHADER